MKEKVEKFVFYIKVTMSIVLTFVTIASGILGEMWPKTEFNWPLLVCAISGTLLVLTVRSICK